MSKDLVVGNSYKMDFPNGNETTAVLREIRGNSLGDDYFFTWKSGYDGLCNKYHGKTENLNDFPFPKSLFHMVTFTDIKDKK